MTERPERKAQPCGHPLDSVVASDEGTSYCEDCEREAGEVEVEGLIEWMETQAAWDRRLYGPGTVGSVWADRKARAAGALRTLTAERYRLEADAKRLDWIQENLAQLDAWAGGTFTVEDLNGVQYYGDTLRQAVDDARRTDTEGGEDE